MNATEQLDIIVQSLDEDGLSIDQLMARLPFQIERRTLQRRLKKLADDHRVIITGGSRSTKYFPTITEVQIHDEDRSSKPQDDIPLSIEGKDVLALVTRPETKRKPVGYQTEFLANYRPNLDSYLTNAEKEHLALIGKTQGDAQAAGTYAKQILGRLLIDLSWNSSRLEGNTYSLLDTEILIHGGRPAENKSAKETQMILNHKDAIEFLVEGADDVSFNRYTILNLHALLSNNLLSNPAASGRLREFGVGITNSVFTPLAIPQLISEFFDLILEKARQIKNPFEQSLFVLIHLPYLQPFDDVNKRVSRLAANIPLNSNNLAPLSFVDVPEEYYVRGMLGIYELNRIELFKDVFIWAYERSAMRYAAIKQSLGEPDPFRLKYREEMRAIISNIVRNGIGKEGAALFIKKEAEKIPENDRNKFVEAVETEILALHEGNFARYRISPSEFKNWKSNWN